VKLRVGARLVLACESGAVEFSDLQQALLLMVADRNGTGLRRAVASDVLWDEDDCATSPRRRLRQIIYAINRRAGSTILDGDQTLIRLADGVEVIWTGEAAGGGIAPPTSHWSRTRDDIHDRARTRSRSHVASAVDSARLRDDPDTILELVATDADPVSMWRDAVWALLRAGRVREAEVSFRDLGIEDPETVRRCRDAIARLASGDAPGPDPHARNVELVGRETVLGDAITALQRGDRRVVLAGPSGTGLSRILGAVAAWALTELDDLVVASTRCTYSGRGVAYDTLNRIFDSDLFRDAHLEVEEPWRSILARVLRVYGRTPERDIEPLEGTSATLRVLHAVSALIERALGNATLLAVVDDLHLADPGSLTVLTHLCVDGDGAVIRLLGASRDDVELDGPIAEIVGGRTSTTIAVPPLSTEASQDLLARLRPDIDPNETRALANLCGGLPRRIEDVARVPHLDQIGGSADSLDDLLREWIGDLSPPEQEVIALLSVRPDGLDAEALMAAARLGTLQLGRATRRLIDLDLVEDDERIRVWSSFLRRGVRATLPSGMRRALHLRIARALQRRSPPAAADIGRHLHQAGELEEAGAWLVRGSEEARQAEAFPVAIELAGIAVGLDPDNADLHDSLGSLLSSEGRFSEASEHLERACTLDERDPASREMLDRRLRWGRALAEHVFDSDVVAGHARDILADAQAGGHLDAEARAIDLLFRVADYCLDFDIVYEALEYLLAARERSEQSPYLDWVEVRRAYIDDPDRARAAAHRFLEFSEPGSADRLEAVARLINQGILRGPEGDTDVQLGAELLEPFSESGHAHLRTLVASNLGSWELDRENSSEAEARLSGAFESARELNGPMPRLIHFNRIELRLRARDLDGAEELLANVEMIGEVAPRDLMLRDTAEALLHLERGALGRALHLVDIWAHVSLDAPVSFFPLLLVIARTKAWSFAGRTDKAKAHYALALQRGNHLPATRALPTLLQLGTDLRA